MPTIERKSEPKAVRAGARPGVQLVGRRGDRVRVGIGGLGDAVLQAVPAADAVEADEVAGGRRPR